MASASTSATTFAATKPFFNRSNHRLHYHHAFALSPSYPCRRTSALRARSAASYPQPSPSNPNPAVATKPAVRTEQRDHQMVPPPFPSRFAADEPRKGADILVEALEREGVSDVFAYPGGASMEIHQALTRSSSIANVLCRHEQGEIFAAEGYARSTGRIGVCIATSGPGATNLVSGLADALLDSIPLVAITGQVPRRMIGTDAFQETPIVEVTRSITKHNYLILDVDDIPRVVREAFFLASSGRPGPVLIDIPKDVQQQLAVPNWFQEMKLHGYIHRLPKPPVDSQLELIVDLIARSKKPVLYIGGGCVNSSSELRRFVDLTGIPVASTLMGLGVFPSCDDLSLQMLGMHGTVYANYAVDKADLLLAFGVRFDDRVTGKLEAFASRASIVHIDIDPAEIGKNKQPHVSLCADIRLALERLNGMLVEKEEVIRSLDFTAWRNELDEQKKNWPMSFLNFGEAIPPQYAIKVLDELTNGEAIISTGVGQHQMWSAQWYKYKRPRQWLTSGGLGAMGFGLPAAIGAAVGNPGSVVVDIDGDGSFIMNVQELATIRAYNLPVKMMVLNNQHLGMVVQWEDRFYKANRAHTYLGNPAKESEIFPNMLKFAEACDIPAARVTRVSEVKGAIQKMLETPGPYLLDVIVPHQEHVLPMIPSGGAFKDVITEGDGRSSY
ncbi:acetolactate synthase 2, chloroplastic-like [Nymphaea colorata]|nr:acetolactate synthase 2, chloroplastic-like [Nymphaea colorata]